MIKRLDEIFDKLEGQKTKTDNEGDEFTNLQKSIATSITELRSQIVQKQKLEEQTGNVIEVARLRQKISSGFMDIEGVLDKLKFLAEKNNKKNVNDVEVRISKIEIVKKFGEIVRQLKNKFLNNNSMTEGSSSAKKVFKLSDLKKENEYLKQNPNNYLDTNNEDDDRVLDEWKAKDQKIDVKLDEVNNILDEIQVLNKNLTTEINKRNELITVASKEATKVSAIIDLQNNKIADLLKKIRSPGRLCGDICMIVLIIGLIAVIVMLVKNGK